jgi:ADP-heptose:LPS heptosyltransferase
MNKSFHQLFLHKYTPRPVFMIKRLKFFIYAMILFLVRNKRIKRTKRILVIKTDEIGDYILWRNFAPYFKSTGRFAGYTLTLCGNRAWKGIAEKFDSNVFDNYIWLDKKKFKSDMRYRYDFLKKISQAGFAITINTLFSRSLRPDDSIVIAASAPLNIGMPADGVNIESFEKGYDKHLYQELADIPTDNIFDFYRNKLFAEKVTGLDLGKVKLSFDRTLLQKPGSLPDNYFIVFPGSNNPARIWNTDNFVAVAKFIQEEYGYHPVICGGPADQPYIDAFTKNYPHPYTQFKEKEGLKDFINALGFAKCLVSIDTGSVHIAAAVQCPVYGVFNGSSYKRFAPYPADVWPGFHAIYPDSVEKDIQQSPVIPVKYKYLSHVDYNEVTAAKMISVIKNSLKKI